jgi:hypothetical protein
VIFFGLLLFNMASTVAVAADSDLAVLDLDYQASLIPSFHPR